MFLISGCGEIPDSLREDEKNYMQIIEKGFSKTEYNIISDKKVQGTFRYKFKDNKVDVHIIDAELKNDPTFKFRICTGFSEVPTLSIEYGYKSNFGNIRQHNHLVANSQNRKHITLKSENITQTHYSKECVVDYYKDTLIFDKNSSVEEIAQELYSYGGFYGTIDIQYGDVKGCLSNYYDTDTVEDLVNSINGLIEHYNEYGNGGYCH